MAAKLTTNMLQEKQGEERLQTSPGDVVCYYAFKFRCQQSDGCFSYDTAGKYLMKRSSKYVLCSSFRILLPVNDKILWTILNRSLIGSDRTSEKSRLKTEQFVTQSRVCESFPNKQGMVWFLSSSRAKKTF